MTMQRVLIEVQDLRDPVIRGDSIRAYCHLHGSDHQRSLSISRTSGYGTCFACQAQVRIAAWNSGATRTGDLMSQSPPSESARQQPSSFSPNRMAWQVEEQAALQMCFPLLQVILATDRSYDVRRARAYLEMRGIPLALAIQEGMGYLPTYSLPQISPRMHWSLRRWRERLVFPLHNGTGVQGFIGRTLWGWQPGMDETTHLQRLRQPRAPGRWIKTRPAGWFGPAAQDLDVRLVLVEGGFDRLALLAAGLTPTRVVALAGVSGPLLLLLEHVSEVVLGLDGDTSGIHAAVHLGRECQALEKRTWFCPPPSDGWGKDWNQRWCLTGKEGLQPVLSAVHLALPLSH